MGNESYRLSVMEKQPPMQLTIPIELSQIRRSHFHGVALNGGSHVRNCPYVTVFACDAGLKGAEGQQLSIPDPRRWSGRGCTLKRVARQTLYVISRSTSD